MTDGIGDEALARRAAAGDGAAFGTLVARHYARIHRIAWRLTGDPAAAEDVAQDVCETLGRRIRSFSGRSAFSTWLYRVVVNAARDAGRKARRAQALGEAWTEADRLGREADAVRAREVAWLRETLAALPRDLRETAVMVLDEGLSHADAAAVLGVREGTVSWRMSEIRRRLKARAREDEGLGA